MLSKLSAFIKYHNAVPIGISLLLLAASGALAASPDIRDSVAAGVYQATQTPVSIDNSYIVNADLDTYTPKIQIIGVTEDDTNYYVRYSFTTIGLKEVHWQEVTDERMMTVAKDFLDGKDLGLYVTRQLAEVSAQEIEKLKATQDIEKKNGETAAVVATSYSGLIGKFLDSKEEVLPGYTPVIPEPEPVSPTPSSSPASPSNDSTGSASGSTSSGTSADTEPPQLSILGNADARVALHAAYVDLGVVITDNVDHNLEARATVDGGDVVSIASISIDTSTTSVHTIRYSANDHAGNTSWATRTVTVYDPFAPVVEAATSTPSDTVEESTSTPETGDAASATSTATSTDASPE